MTIYDGIMIGLVVAGMAWGAWKGITWQLAGLASLILGYLVAIPAAGPLAEKIHFPGNPSMQWGLALTTSYAAVSGLVFLAAWSVRTTLRRMKFEAYDRHLGMVLGGVEAALVGVIATVMIVSLAPSVREPVRTSHAGVFIGKTLTFVESALPDSARKALKPLWEAAEKDGLMADDDGHLMDVALDALDDAKETVRRRLDGQDDRPPAEEASDLIDGIVKEGKARVGQAVRDAINDQLGTLDDEPAPRRRTRDPRDR